MQTNALLKDAEELARTMFAGRTDKAGVDYFAGHLSSVAGFMDGDKLAIAVKIADLTNNSDYIRFGASNPDELQEKYHKRWEKYQKSLEILRS